MTFYNQTNIRTLCYCWIIARADQTRLGFTDHDDVVEVDGILCQPETGMVTGSSEIESGFSINGGQVEAALNAEAITTKDILDGLYDRAKVQQYLVNWRDQEKAQLLRTMTIAKVTQSDGKFTAEMDGLLSGFDAPQGRYFRRQCDAELGDAKCGIDLQNAAYSFSSNVEENSETSTIIVSALDQPEAHFINGSISINASDYKIANIRVYGQLWEIILAKSLNKLVVKDTPCELIKGCNKSFATCKNRFSNQLNFRGFPHIPGGDAAYQFAKSDDVFDGKPIVP